MLALPLFSALRKQFWFAMPTFSYFVCLLISYFFLFCFLNVTCFRNIRFGCVAWDIRSRLVFFFRENSNDLTRWLLVSIYWHLTHILSKYQNHVQWDCCRLDVGLVFQVKARSIHIKPHVVETKSHSDKVTSHTRFGIRLKYAIKKKKKKERKENNIQQQKLNRQIVFFLFLNNIEPLQIANRIEIKIFWILF